MNNGEEQNSIKGQGEQAVFPSFLQPYDWQQEVQRVRPFWDAARAFQALFNKHIGSFAQHLKEGKGASTFSIQKGGGSGANEVVRFFQSRTPEECRILKKEKKSPVQSRWYEKEPQEYCFNGVTLWIESVIFLDSMEGRKNISLHFDPSWAQENDLPSIIDFEHARSGWLHFPHRKKGLYSESNSELEKQKEPSKMMLSTTGELLRMEFQDERGYFSNLWGPALIERVGRTKEIQEIWFVNHSMPEGEERARYVNGLREQCRQRQELQEKMANDNVLNSVEKAALPTRKRL